jgi:hypothetical protein
VLEFLTRFDSTDVDPLTAAGAVTHAKLRQRLEAFWSDPARLPHEAPARLRALFNTFYVPRNERTFLPSASRLLLSLCAASPMYTRKYHDQPLERCRFRSYKVDPSRPSRTLASTLSLAAGGASAFELASLASLHRGVLATLKATALGPGGDDEVEEDEQAAEQIVGSIATQGMGGSVARKAWGGDVVSSLSMVSGPLSKYARTGTQASQGR